MAAVIASAGASERFTDDPEEFGQEFGLSESELAMLIEMGDDLTSLTAAFVAKRQTTLRWNARRTLDMLGDEGLDLLDDFVDEYPQSDSFRNDAAAFGNYVISATQSRPRPQKRDLVIAEMARFEKHRSDSFWDATARMSEPNSSPSTTPGVGDKPEAAVLAAGANVGHFELDMRLAYRHNVKPWRLLPPDPCDLLFFHTPRSALLLTVRLRPLEAQVLRQMPAGTRVEVSAIRESAPEGVDVEHLLRTLNWKEAIEWA